MMPSNISIITQQPENAQVPEHGKKIGRNLTNSEGRWYLIYINVAMKAINRD
jgi:hypothetical protein